MCRLREQLRKEIVKRTGECVQSAEGAAVYEEESARIAESYDRMVAEGMAELDAYKALLNDINIMRMKLLAVQAEEAAAAAEKQEPKTAKKEEKRKNKKLRALAGGMQAILCIWEPYTRSSGQWKLVYSHFAEDISAHSPEPSHQWYIQFSHQVFFWHRSTASQSKDPESPMH